MPSSAALSETITAALRSLGRIHHCRRLWPQLLLPVSPTLTSVQSASAAYCSQSRCSQLHLLRPETILSVSLTAVQANTLSKDRPLSPALSPSVPIQFPEYLPPEPMLPLLHALEASLCCLCLYPLKSQISVDAVQLSIYPCADNNRPCRPSLESLPSLL